MIRYDENEYRVQRADESYRSVCMQYYRSEEYAPALQAYNREHPLNRQPANGQLVVGEIVRVPDLFRLEQKYGNLIPTVQALGQVGTRQ